MLETKEKNKKDKEQSVTKEGSVPAVEPTTPEELQLVVVSELDRLKAENAQLRLMNESARYSSLTIELERSAIQVDRLKAVYVALIQEIGAKYGFNPDETEMEPSTGRILPRGTLRR